MQHVEVMMHLRLRHTHRTSLQSHKTDLEKIQEQLRYMFGVTAEGLQSHLRYILACNGQIIFNPVPVDPWQHSSFPVHDEHCVPGGIAATAATLLQHKPMPSMSPLSINPA